jgi:hypothetical protein
LASMAAIAPILALHQNSSYLQRKQTVATIITAIVQLGSLGALCSSVFVGVHWTCVVSQNVSCVGQGVGEGTPSLAQGVDKDLDTWFRQSAVKILQLSPLLTALLLPTSRGARWIGIIFQLTVVPAAQVSGGCVWSVRRGHARPGERISDSLRARACVYLSSNTNSPALLPTRTYVSPPCPASLSTHSSLSWRDSSSRSTSPTVA